MKRFHAVVLVLLLSLPVGVAVKSGEMTLLTVAKHPRSGNTTGGTAELYLEVRPGSGKLFIESYPLTKLNTQISTRFARDVACSMVDIDCSRYDFYYTIRAGSSIVGGPSAGAAAAALTAAVLQGESFNRSVSITGTINSGGIIGPVAGVVEKVAAAQRAGLKKVVIPEWVHFNSSTFQNQTGSELRIDVVKAADLSEAFYHFTGERQPRIKGEIKVDPEYRERMRGIAQQLCSRMRGLANKTDTVIGDNYTEKIVEARNHSRYYTTASYCFRKNVELRQAYLANRSTAQLVSEVGNALDSLESSVEAQSLETMSDLETYMIVKERIVDAEQSLKELNKSNVSSDTLGYVVERYYSAVAWSNFFDMEGHAFRFDKEYLRSACQQRVREAEERLEYVTSIAPGFSNLPQEELEVAQRYRRNEEFAPCIFKASMVKAEANMLLMALTTSKDRLEDVVAAKLDATKRVILEQQRRGIFPILGYSYYEYAKALKDSEPSNALLFSEYALEMSNLDMYFPRANGLHVRLPNLHVRDGLFFLLGVVVTIGIIWVKPKKTR